jgi:hypothetical protein
VSRHASKPIDIGTVTAGNAFVQPGSPPSTGRLPHRGVYHPDSLEIEFLVDSGTPTVQGPIELDAWALDPDGTEVVFDQITLSTVAVSPGDVLPPVKVKGRTVAVSLRTGLVGGGDVQARVTWVEIRR